MHRLRIVLVFLAMIALCSTWAEGQDKTKDQPGKLRGQLPANWGKLGLSDEQKQRVYKVQNDYRPKIDDLQKKVDDLKAVERKDMEAVLTDVRTDLDPPRVLGYSLPGRGRFDLRSDRILAISHTSETVEPAPS